MPTNPRPLQKQDDRNVNILLSIDDSRCSSQAVDFVLSRRWPESSHIKVITVVDTPELPDAADAVDLLIETSGQKIAEDTKEYETKVAYSQRLVSQMARQLEQEFPDIFVEYQLLHGYSKETIIEFASNWPADLVILGSHGRRGLGRILLGSVSQSVLLYGDCSTLIVRAQKERPKRDSQQLNVLLAVDPSPHSRAVIDYVLSMPWSDATTFKILTASKPLLSKYDDGINALHSRTLSQGNREAIAENNEFLNQTQLALAEAFSRERVSTILAEGDPGESILDVANAWPAGLIVMGSRGHGTMRRLWVGSVSQEVVLQAQCPVEIVKRRVQ